MNDNNTLTVKTNIQNLLQIASFPAYCSKKSWKFFFLDPFTNIKDKLAAGTKTMKKK